MALSVVIMTVLLALARPAAASGYSLDSAELTTAVGSGYYASSAGNTPDVAYIPASAVLAGGFTFTWTTGAPKTWLCRHHVQANVREDIDMSAFATDPFVQTDPASIADTRLSRYGFDWKLCGDPALSYTINSTYLVDGYHTFALKMSNNGGLTWGPTELIAWKIDSLPPATSYTLDPTTTGVMYTNIGTQKLILSVTDYHGSLKKVAGTTLKPNPPYAEAVSVADKPSCAGEACEESLIKYYISKDNSGVWTEITMWCGVHELCLYVADFAAGPHTIQIRAMDAASNMEIEPTTWSFYKENHASTTGCTYQYSFNGSAYASLAAGVSEKALSGMKSSNAGPAIITEHTFSVRAVDDLGNIGPANNFTWFIDQSYTGAQFTETNTYGNAATALFIEFTSNYNTLAFKVERSWVPGASYITCPSPSAPSCTRSETFPAGSLPAGHSYWYSVAAVDTVGNVNPKPIFFNWTVDPIDTDLDVTLTKDGATFVPVALRDSPVVDFVYEWRLDNSQWKRGKGPSFTVKGLKDGKHTVRVRTAGLDNMVWDPTPANWTWGVDTVAPVVAITTHPAATTNSASATFVITSTEDGHAEYRLDNGPYVPFAGLSVTLVDILEGAHTFAVRVTDFGGNVGLPATYAWTIDFGPPNTFIRSGPSSPTRETRSAFLFASTEPGITYQYRIDNNVAWNAVVNGSRLLSPVLDEGTHTLQVRAIDVAGNIDTTPAAYSWTIYDAETMWPLYCDECAARKAGMVPPMNIEDIEFPGIPFPQHPSL